MPGSAPRPGCRSYQSCTQRAIRGCLGRRCAVSDSVERRTRRGVAELRQRRLCPVMPGSGDAPVLRAMEQALDLVGWVSRRSGRGSRGTSREDGIEQRVPEFVEKRCERRRSLPGWRRYCDCCRSRRSKFGRSIQPLPVAGGCRARCNLALDLGEKSCNSFGVEFAEDDHGVGRDDWSSVPPGSTGVEVFLPSRVKNFRAAHRIGRSAKFRRAALRRDAPFY